jgi:hypothetical protein
MTALGPERPIAYPDHGPSGRESASARAMHLKKRYSNGNGDSHDQSDGNPRGCWRGGESPRGGNTEILLDRFLAGAGESGAAVEKIVLAGLKVRSCVACEKRFTTGALRNSRRLPVGFRPARRGRRHRLGHASLHKVLLGC